MSLNASASEPADAALDGELPPQPSYSTITVDRRADGLTITVPPMGKSKVSKGLLSFAVLWLLFVAVFTAVMIGSLVSGNPLRSSSGAPISGVWGFLFLVPFWAVGIGTLLAARNMDKRCAILDVVGALGPRGASEQMLLVTQKSLFRTRQREWPRERVTAIDAGPSGIEVNDIPLLQLRIHLSDRREKFGLCTGRGEDELRWLAALLRGALGCAALVNENWNRRISDPSAPPLALPADSRCTVNRRPGGLTLVVPPRGLRGAALVLLLVGLGAAAVAAGLAVVFQAMSPVRSASFFPFFVAGFFVLIGALMTAASLHMAMARATFEVVGRPDGQEATLTATAQGLLGSRQHTWRRVELADIRLGPSGTEINGRKLLELQVRATGRKKVGYLGGRDEMELAWIAQTLREALGIQAATAPTPV